MYYTCADVLQCLCGTNPTTSPRCLSPFPPPAYQGIFCSYFFKLHSLHSARYTLNIKHGALCCWQARGVGYQRKLIRYRECMRVLEMQIDTRLQTFVGPLDMTAGALRVCHLPWLWVCRSAILLSPVSSHPCLVSQDAVRTMASGIGGDRDRGRRRCARRLPTPFCQPSLARSCPQASQTPTAPQVSASML